MPFLYRHGEVLIECKEPTHGANWLIDWYTWISKKVAYEMDGKKNRKKPLQILSEVAELPSALLKPLEKLSTGVYSEEDYVLQFEEEWEQEEYGESAFEIVAKNKKAWQAIKPLVEAVSILLQVLQTNKKAEALSSSFPEMFEFLQWLRQSLQEAISHEAREICLELPVE